MIKYTKRYKYKRLRMFEICFAQNQEKSVQYINTNTGEGINEKTNTYSGVLSFGFPERY